MNRGIQLPAGISGLGTKGTIVYGAAGPDEHLIVTVGVEDLIIVHTPDATLVANRRDEESLRQVVKELAQRGYHVNL